MWLHNALYLDGEMKFQRADIRLADGKIEEICPVDSKGREGAVLDCTDRIVLPGLVNAHFHSQSESCRGLTKDLPITDWCGSDAQGQWFDRVTDAIDQSISEEDFRTLCRYSYAAMVKQGVTCIQDSGLGERPPNWQRECMEGFHLGGRIDAYTAFERVHEDGNDRLGFSAHLLEEEDIDEDAISELTSNTFEKGMLKGAHCLETRHRRNLVEESQGKSTIELWADLGLLGADTLLFHCVHVTEADISLLASHGTGVAHCPVSNATTGEGVAPVEQMLVAGVCVGLGTDWEHNDYWEVMRQTYLSLKVKSQDPSHIVAETVWRMATKNGARCLGMGHRTGEIGVGFDADLFLVDRHSEKLGPMVHTDSFSNIAHNLLMYGGPDAITDVFVAGNRLVSTSVFDGYTDLVEARQQVVNELVQGVTVAPGAE